MIDVTAAILMDNGRVYRLDKDDGSPIDSSLVNSLTTGRITISADSIVYINSTEGDYYALSYDLQTTLWYSTTYNLNYYAGPSLSREGIMILCGAGNTIKAFKFEGQHAPVADFRANTYHIVNIESVSFTDQSSFSPTSWYWEFPGGDPPASTEQNPVNITYPQSGIYDVTLIASNEIDSDTVTKPCYIEVDYVVGVETHDQRSNVTVYPNPADDHVFLSTEHGSGTWMTNCLGEVVYRDLDLKKERKIDCSKFNSGMYIVTLVNDGFTRSEKLVINH